ncbi:hypothetical protein SH2C18_21310 [Clostridium sediminicola]
MMIIKFLNIFTRFLKMAGAVISYISLYFITSFLALIIALMFLMINGSELNILENAELIETINFKIMPLFLILFFIICYGVFKIINRDLIKFCRFNRFRISYVVPIILIAIFTTGISLVCTQYGITIFPDYAEVSNTYSMAAKSIIGILGIIVFAPILEEILFRGMIFNRMREDMNVVLAAILQAIIFGMMHGNMLQFFYTFALALIMAYVYVKTDSLWMSILVHITYNLFGVAIYPALLDNFNIPLILFGIINIVLLIGSFMYFNFMVKIEKTY